MGKKVALGGIMTAVSIILLYMAFYLPSIKLTMYFLAGVIPGLILIEMGVRQAWLLYLAVSLLSLVVLGNIVNSIPYICVFGLYPIVKYYIEKTGRMYVETALKLIFFNAALLSVYFIWTRLFMLEIVTPISIIWIIVGIQFAFLLYDYVFTRIIFYYLDRKR